jgi:hypothetical protein
MSGDRACPDCGQPVIRARTEAMSWQLLDTEPAETGSNIAARRDAQGTWWARTLHGDQQPAGGERLLIAHYATSPGCGQKHRARQRAQVKTARSAHAAGKRTQRGKRPGPQVTGVRVPPPPRQEGTA